MREGPKRGLAVAGSLSIVAIIISLTLSQTLPIAAATIAVVAVVITTVLRPAIGVGIWLIITSITPFWTTISTGGTPIFPYYLNIPIAIGLILRTATTPRERRSSSLNLLDIIVTIAVFIAVILTFTSGMQSFLYSNMLYTLYGGYIIGRHSPVKITKLYVVVMTILAIWGVIEFAFGWHAFVDWQATSGGMGPSIQERGGYARSEATMGHAIAYGAALVSAIPFTREFRSATILQVVLIAGVLSSLSRGPIFAAMLAVALNFYLERNSSHRVRMFLLLSVGVALAYLLIGSLYAGSGQEELDSSSNARGLQIDNTFGLLRAIGQARDTQWNPGTGRYETNGISLVDNSFLRLALDYGWVVPSLLAIPFLVAAYLVIRRKAGIAAQSLVTQLPIVFVTSLITQWQILLLFVVGLFVQELAKSRSWRPASASALPNSPMTRDENSLDPPAPDEQPRDGQSRKTL